MRIGIDARLWNETGVGRYIRNLVWGIDQHADSTDHSFIIYLFPHEYKNLSFQSSKIEKRLAPFRWHTLTEQVAFPRAIQRDLLDLMHFTYYSVPYTYNRPYVVTLHDLIIYNFFTGRASTLPLPLYAIKHSAYKILLKNAQKKAAKIIVPLEATKADVIKNFPQARDKIVVTYEGFDAAFSQKGEVSEDIKSIVSQQYLLYVGNAYPHKNLERLLIAFSLVQRENTKINLVLVGKDDFFYQRLSKKVTNSMIHFFHSVSDSDLASLYRHAAALVSPSLVEGFGLTPLEAMSMNTLVAVSNIPAFCEVCDNAALYFDPKDPQKIAEVLNYLLHMRSSERQQYIEKGQQRAKIFSWEKMVIETMRVYESCFSINQNTQKL